MNQPPRVAVLIAACNEEAHLGAALESLKAQGLQPHLTVIVDDASTDATSKIAVAHGAILSDGNVEKTVADALADQRLLLISLPVASGRKTDAQQRALPYLACAGVEYVVTLDADTVLADEHTIVELVRALEGPNPPAGACGFILPKERKSFFQRARWIEYLVGQRIPKYLQSRLNMMLVLSGCFACWRLDQLHGHGGFHSNVWLAEDMGLTTKFLTSGPRFGKNRHRAVLVPRAIAYTLDPQTFRLYRRQLSRWYSGFFQNFLLHKKELLRFRNPGLSALIFYTFIEGVALPFFYLGIPIFAFSFGWTWEFAFVLKFFLLWLLAVQFGVIALAAIVQDLPIFIRSYRGSRRSLVKAVPVRLAELFVALVCYIVLAVFFNMFWFLWRFVMEMILRRPLKVWNKGH